MIEYHKIQSVYLRDPANRHKTFLEGQWSLPEFGYLASIAGNTARKKKAAR